MPEYGDWVKLLLRVFSRALFATDGSLLTSVPSIVQQQLLFSQHGIASPIASISGGIWTSTCRNELMHTTTYPCATSCRRAEGCGEQTYLQSRLLRTSCDSFWLTWLTPLLVRAQSTHRGHRVELQSVLTAFDPATSGLQAASRPSKGWRPYKGGA